MASTRAGFWPHLREALSHLPPVIPAVFKFRAVSSISPVRHFTGPSWYAHFASVLGLETSTEFSLKTGAEFVMVPLHPAGARFEKGDEVPILITFTGETTPAVLASALANTTAAKSRLFAYTDAFEFTGYDIALPDNCGSLQPKLLEQYIRALASRETTTILFETPLLLKDFAGRSPKGGANQWVQPGSLTPDRLLWACWARLCDLTGTHPGDRPSGNDTPFASSTLVWTDVTWRSGEAEGKRMGGLLGRATIGRRLPRCEAVLLTWGSLLQIGKQTAFGLGRFRLPEMDHVETKTPRPRLRRAPSRRNTGPKPR
jgi:hypothetical protein